MSTFPGNYLQALAAAMRQRRLQQKLTQEQVAELADLSANYFARIERGEINLTFEKVVRIAYALNIKPSALLKSAEKRL